MRCLIVVPSLKRAGAETQAIDLANGLATRGHSIHLCTFEPELDQRPRVNEAVKFHHLPRNAKFDVSLVKRIGQLIDQEQIEVIQAILQFSVLLCVLAVQLASRKPRIVAAIHTTKNVGAKEEVLDRLLYRRILSKVTIVIFVCRFQRDYWINKYPELRPCARVVYNGIDVGRFARDQFVGEARRLRITQGIAESAFAFISVAAFRPEKGHLKLLEAFAKLPAGPYLLLAGDGNERSRIERTIESIGLADRVRLLGSVADIRPAIVASDATVLASTAVETFSMAMLESMALEVPMISTRVGGVEEAITNLNSGMICQPGEVDSLAAAMKYLLERPNEARSMGQAARLVVSSTFTLDRMVSTNEELLVEASLHA